MGFKSSTALTRSLVPRPCACLSIAVQNSHRGPGIVHHVMCAASFYVTPDIAKSLYCRDNHKWSWKNMKQVTHVR